MLLAFVVLILIQPVSVLRIPAAPSRIPPAKCGRFHSLRYRIEVVGKLHLNGAERHAGRSGSGKDTSYRKCRFIPPHQSLTRQLPPKGKPFCKIPFALHDKATRANRKGKPQLKDIFDISAMYATFAVFAQCKEGFPLGGSCRVSD